MALSIDWTGLSPDSKRSLELQGGIYSQEEADAFIARPHVAEAVQLRIWDDEAKVAGLATFGNDPLCRPPSRLRLARGAIRLIAADFRIAVNPWH